MEKISAVRNLSQLFRSILLYFYLIFNSTTLKITASVFECKSQLATFGKYPYKFYCNIMLLSGFTIIMEKYLFILKEQKHSYRTFIFKRFKTHLYLQTKHMHMCVCLSMCIYKKDFYSPDKPYNVESRA